MEIKANYSDNIPEDLASQLEGVNFDCINVKDSQSHRAINEENLQDAKRKVFKATSDLVLAAKNALGSIPDDKITSNDKTDDNDLPKRQRSYSSIKKDSLEETQARQKLLISMQRVFRRNTLTSLSPK